MKVIEPVELPWEGYQAGDKATLFATPEPAAVEVQVLRVPAGATLAPHHYPERRRFLCVMHTAGARLVLGSRVFRPLPGQAFQCDPGEVMAVANDTRHEIRLLVTLVGPESEPVWSDKTLEQYLAEVRADSASLLSPTQNPAGR
jgi:quercetin dioxygenase-like cupin family protein